VPQNRVLLVDYSKFVRTTFKGILGASFTVLEEADGEAAWQALSRDPAIVMVFTDLDMPKLNGFGLLARIRGAAEARIRELPVVVISGAEDPSAKQRACEAGATDFISKSADAPEVLSRIDNLLRLVSASRTATHDAATGTLTPHYLLTEGRKHYGHARRHGRDLAVMALRLESHAEIVRGAGKEIAEIVVARVAKLLLSKVRADDSVARVAAASFLVIAPGTTATQMQALGARLRLELAEAKVKHGERTLSFPSRVGVASLGADGGAAIEELMRLAMQRLDEKTAPRPARPATPPAASPALPADLEAALARLEQADWTGLAAAAPQVMQRLQRIAAKLRR
jgi:diguanylate cyclase (GGDEF)-like protein